MAPYKILKQGYMMKEPPVSKRGIRKRVFRYWFVLVEDSNQVALVYFKSEDAYIARHKNEGFIRVDEAQNISVIGEHMGHKNAFVVRTPKGEYHLMPESRYDLHEWLFTLHTSLENFQKRMQRNKERKQQEQPQARPRANGQQPQARPRANTVDSQQPQARPRTNTDSQHKPSATAGHTPPYRRAPPPPKSPENQGTTYSAVPQPQSGSPQGVSQPQGASNVGQSEGGTNTRSSGRKRPSRPAPVAPGRRRSSDQRLSQETPTSPGTNLSQQLPQETPPPQYSASLPAGEMRALYEAENWMSQEGYSDQDPFSTMESGQHMVVDLNITQTDEISPGDEDSRHRIASGRSQPSPVHMRSSSDSLVLMHSAVSNSLPDLINEESSGSPENPEERVGPVGRANMPHISHTRHLSLMGGMGGSFREPCSKQGRKKKPKRASSVKQRSRSPPNLPPPPPPMSPGGCPTSQTPDQVDGPADTNGATANSEGFSGVLDTITDIDQQLDSMAQEFSTFKPHPSPTKASPKRAHVSNTLFIPPAPEHDPSPTLSDEGAAGASFHEEEWLCDLPKAAESRDGGPPPHNTAKSDHTHTAGVTNGVLAVSEKPLKQKLRVMFKEEVEAIPPNNYEPRVDSSTPPSEDAVPTGVAAIKMRLFGQQEQEPTRYKKEGILSPKYTHPVNMMFGESYFDVGTTGYPDPSSPDESDIMDHMTYRDPYPLSPPGQRDSSPNVNNNNSGGGSATTDTAAAITNGHTPKPDPFPEDPEEPKQNLYDNPWEHKAVNKVVIRRSVSPAGPMREKSPPPPIAPRKLGPKIQFAEVSVKETPKPIPTEVRNVHSLERKRVPQHLQSRYPQGRSSTSPPTPHRKEGGRASISPPTPREGDDDSLLASISDTLQVTSRYGSDSFLSNGDGNTPAVADSAVRRSSGELKISSRGELEKIKAAHRKEVAPVVLKPSPLVQTAPLMPHSLPLAQASMKPYQHSSPQIYPAKFPTRGQRGVVKGRVGIGTGIGLGKAPRLATSLEAIERRRDTHVTYDASTQAHIFRSLV